jgi:PAS domain S-box-containing protein
MSAVHPPLREPAAVPDDPGPLYRLIAETIPHMVWTTRADGSDDFSNQQLRDYTGMDAASLSDWGWKAVIHPDDLDRCVTLWTHSLQTGERYAMECRLRRFDGVFRWHHLSALPQRGAGGQLLHWFGTCTDIEDQVRGAQQMERLVEERTRELCSTEKRLRALIDNEPECVKLLDAEGRLLEMNAAGLRMIEADQADQVIDKCVYPIIAPEHVDAFRDLTERVCRGARGSLEFELVGLKGTRRWMETHAVPFRDEARGETRLLAITRDITDRRRAEQALRESEQRFQQFLEHLPANAWIRDARFRFTYANRLYARTWGVAPEALLGREVGEFFSAEVAKNFLETDRQVLRDLAPIEYVDSQPSGRWLKVKFPVPDGSGGTAVAGVAIDITESSRLEEALRESEQRFRSFMENAPTVAWIKDARFRYTYVNRAFEASFRRSREQALGRDDFEIFPAELARYMRDFDEAVLREGGTVQKLRRAVQPGGPQGHWLGVKFPLADASGATGVAGMAIDVTPQVEAEEKASRYAQEARDLMHRLVGAQEAERRRVADELHDLIGQNLTALGIDLQTLKEQLQAAGQAAAAPRLDAMAKLVEMTIGAIRGVMGELRPAALEEFGLLPALRWHAALFAKRTGIRVSTHAGASGLRPPSDVELALFRIAQEALTNAAKHSGGTAVDISIERDGGRFRLTIEDDGRGFDEAVLGARARGFGLQSMRERAEAHGGTLTIERPGRGARLVVEIPAVRDAD